MTVGEPRSVRHRVVGADHRDVVAGQPVGDGEFPAGPVAQFGRAADLGDHGRVAEVEDGVLAEGEQPGVGRVGQAGGLAGTGEQQPRPPLVEAEHGGRFPS